MGADETAGRAAGTEQTRRWGSGAQPHALGSTGPNADGDKPRGQVLVKLCCSARTACAARALCSDCPTMRLGCDRVAARVDAVLLTPAKAEAHAVASIEAKFSADISILLQNTLLPFATRCLLDQTPHRESCKSGGIQTHKRRRQQGSAPLENAHGAHASVRASWDRSTKRTVGRRLARLHTSSTITTSSDALLSAATVARARCAEKRRRAASHAHFA